MKKNNNLNIKFISNLIYYLCIPIISLFYLSTLLNSHNIDKKGFIISYNIGIFTITIITMIYIFFKNKHIKKQEKNKNHNKYSTLFFIIFILFYILICINLIQIPLNHFNLSSGLINIIKYTNKILLISGCALSLNLLISFFSNIPEKIILNQNIIKLLLFIILGYFLTNIFKYKGLLYLISALEFTNLIYTIIFNEINQKTKK